jgi:hypothetical protein
LRLFEPAEHQQVGMEVRQLDAGLDARGSGAIERARAAFGEIKSFQNSWTCGC